VDMIVSRICVNTTTLGTSLGMQCEFESLLV
jgi:hypothetical protein